MGREPDGPGAGGPWPGPYSPVSLPASIPVSSRGLGGRDPGPANRDRATIMIDSASDCQRPQPRQAALAG